MCKNLQLKPSLGGLYVDHSATKGIGSILQLQGPRPRQLETRVCQNSQTKYF